MDMMKNGNDWLASKMLAVTSTTINYYRADTGTYVSVSAVVGRTSYDVDNGYGAIEKWESRDFLIDKAVLIGGQHQGDVWPKRGDKIYESPGPDPGLNDASIQYIYEVMAPGSEPVWEYADAYRNLIRVHTKYVNRVGLTP
jgi:hypothetical protein